MNLNFLCCIGAELKNSVQQTTRMTQVYLYRAFEEETIADMLATGFFNDALGIIRQDDLLLLYSPNETPGKYVYARVSSVGRDGVEIEKVNIRAEEITVDTTGYTNLSGNNLQQILNNLDALLTTMNNAFVKIDGTSIMTGPLKMRSSVSFKCAIAPSWDGVGFYKLNDNDSLTLMASMETTDGLCPASNNTYNIGKASHKWKDAHIARVITAVINNGYDIAVPVTNSADTLALKSEVDNAANSGRMITDQGVWFAKMYAATVPPAADDGTNYADFSQTDGEGNPIIVIYERQSGAWVQSETITPPANYDGYVPVTKKIWDIVEQTGQNGGRILWNHQSKQFTPYPQIVDLSDVATTDLDNLTPTGEAKFTAKANTDMDNLTSTGQNIANWSSNVGNCISEIPQDIKLELDLSTHTLILKAGSKAYIPNGFEADNTTPHFDIITTTTDLSLGPVGSGSTGSLVYIKSDGSTITQAVDNTSGTTAPSGSGMWYDTNTNLIKGYSGGVDTGFRYALPIAAATRVSGDWVSIDKVFNGLGYIGLRVFLLPGVKVLIPNGLNADGSCNNTEFTVSSVITKDSPGIENCVLVFCPNDSTNYLIGRQQQDAVISNHKPANTGAIQKYWYNPRLNIMYKSMDSGATWEKFDAVFIGKYYFTTAVASLTPNSGFHAVDYNDTLFISNQPMPSNRYIDLTLGASGSSYIAVADGYVVLRKSCSAANQYVMLENKSNGMRHNPIGSFSAAQCCAYLPVSKGDEVYIVYTVAGATNMFRFIYANGAK